MSVEPTSQWKQNFRRKLLSWFRKNARDLPWRQTREPYCIWVSEIMLQQTQVSTVVPYYVRFVERFPDVESLASAEEEEVLRYWEGLGYYRRCRHLHRAARQIVQQHDGRVPDDPKQLQALPGIGRYTAGAILSIAHDAREPILEANTVRLYSRLSKFQGDTASQSGNNALWRFAELLLPVNRTGAFNQALMELGSEICSPQKPRCDNCPVQTLCPTFAHGLQASIPSATARTQYEDVQHVCFAIWSRNRLLLRQYRDGERWAGLWDLPRFESRAKGESSHHQFVPHVFDLTGLTISPGPLLMTLKHGVTRFRITLRCYEATSIRGRIRSGLRWVRPQETANLPLHVTGRKICQKLCGWLSGDNVAGRNNGQTTRSP